MKIHVPEGFQFGVVSAGIKEKGKHDLSIIYCDSGANVAGVFTTNTVKAAPVIYSSEILEKNYNDIKAVLINSGNANACTGDRGLRDCHTISEELSKTLNIDKDKILLSSTGVIGVPLPVDSIVSSFPKLVENMSVNNIEKVASAIMTTDTYPKIYSVKEDDKNFTVCGIAKGAGMINPNMATMLAFILTDAYIEQNMLKNMLKEITEKTFNIISVDGDTSTNDTVFVMSSGKKKGIDTGKFFDNLYNTMLKLAKMIVKDGEGATKLIKITVKGGKSVEQCKRICKGIAGSPLVKTAFFGCDPNWGRIICAVGYSDDNVIQKKIDIFFDNHKIVAKGVEADEFSERDAAKYLSENDEINLIVNLNIGDSFYEYYTCDLTYDYIKINAEYRT